MDTLTRESKVYWQIEEFICHNWNNYIGCSVKTATMAHKFTAHQVNKEYELSVSEFDVLTTMRYMREMNILVFVGMFGTIETYTVNKEYRE